MGKLSNALQGGLNKEKGEIRGRGNKQLDLFLSLSDRAETKPRLTSSYPPPAEESSAPEPRPEPEMILPPSTPPLDVSAEVRAVLSGSEPRPAEDNIAPDGTIKPPLRTGIYRRPQRRKPPTPDPAPRSAAPRSPDPLKTRILDWVAEVEIDRRLVALVIVLVVVVALVAFWSACPRSAEVGTTVDLREIQDASLVDAGAASAVPAKPSPASQSPARAPSPKAPVAADWKVAGAEITVVDGGYGVRFNDPVFVSANYLSSEGMTALKALAVKLVAMKGGVRVIVTGHTDDIPLSRPTPEFQNNADLAAARAKVAMDHLVHYARANKALTFEMRTGTIADAPYPNDSNRNRRLNRTATVQVMPAHP